MTDESQGAGVVRGERQTDRMKSDPSPGPCSRVPDALQAFYTGQGFYVAGRRAMENRPLGPETVECPYGPSAAILAFSAEVFIKSLLFAQSPQPIRGHDLAKLFSQLSASDQAAVRARYTACYPIGYSIDEDLAETATYFEEMRYWFENTTRRGYDPNAAARLADTLYRHTATVVGWDAYYDQFRA